jgi:NAD(P)-dependent dehydrogenase (short-subunit alcohol dehydrogenase family)
VGLLEGRVAIVVGAASGIGRASAIRFAEEGASVVGCDRRVPELEETIKEIESKGTEALAVECDVAEEAQIDNVVGSAAERFGRIEILANFAQGGLDDHAYILEATRERVLESFLTGPLQSLLFMQKCFPYMKAQRYGRIVNAASHSALVAPPGYTAYAMAKAAIMALTRSASQEWGQFGIVTNTILPLARTPPWDWTPQATEAAKGMAERNPMRRVGDPYEDTAPVVAFLVSEGAGYLNGQAIGIDGGARLFA